MDGIPGQKVRPFRKKYAVEEDDVEILLLAETFKVRASFSVCGKIEVHYRMPGIF
jgi:hypothetical protein